MATVVNARDVILQAALPNGRVAGVTMQPNIAVDPSQVTGLGLIILGTKTVDLESSSQVYQVATSGTATPSTITLTLNLRNIVGTPSISIISGSYTGGLPALSGGPAVYTASIAYANLTTDTITIRASVTESSITYTDDVTLVKARDGMNAVNAFLTNESHTVPSSDTGVVSSYTGAGGTFKVYQGSTDVSASATYTLQSNPNSLTTSINSTTGVFSVTAGFAGGIDVATVTYRATYGAQTFDKIFTIAKSKAGSAGAAGSRGSRTFYLSGISVWSDSSATTAASVSGGPIINDVVTEYNTTNFSETRFWNGSSWIVVNGVVDGNLLVSGTVGASAIQANAIRATHLLVQGAGGYSVWADTNYTDPSGWGVASWGTVHNQVIISDGVSGNTVMRSVGTTQSSAYGLRRVPVTIGRRYRVSLRVRRDATANGTFYCRLDGGTGETSTYDQVGALIEGITPTTTWTLYSAEWVASVPLVAPMVLLNYGGSAGYHEAQDIRIEEMLDSSLVVTGGLTADRIDTRGLTIKDAGGTVIFSSGVPLTAANADNTLRNDAIVVGGRNLVANSAVISAANSWNISNATPGGTGLADPAGGTSAASWTLTSTSYDLYRTVSGLRQGATYTVSLWVELGTAPNLALVVNNTLAWNTHGGVLVTGAGWRRASVTFIASSTGAVNIHLGAHSNTGPGQQSPGTVNLAYLQLEEGNAATQWGLTPDEARNANITIAGGVISGIGTGNGTAVANSGISINSGGVLSGAGGGTVTIGGLDSTVVRSANPITSGNVSTYIGSAAIGTAQVGTLNASVITAGTITTDRLQVGAVTQSTATLGHASSFNLASQAIPQAVDVSVETLNITTGVANGLVTLDGMISVRASYPSTGMSGLYQATVGVTIGLSGGGGTRTSGPFLMPVLVANGAREVQVALPLFAAYSAYAASTSVTATIRIQVFTADNVNTGISGTTGTVYWNFTGVLKEAKV